MKTLPTFPEVPLPVLYLDWRTKLDGEGVMDALYRLSREDWSNPDYCTSEAERTVGRNPFGAIFSLLQVQGDVETDGEQGYLFTAENDEGSIQLRADFGSARNSPATNWLHFRSRCGSNSALIAVHSNTALMQLLFRHIQTRHAEA